VLALLLAGCQDMSSRDYYIFARPSSSQPPATQAPQPVSRPPEPGPQAAPPAIVVTPAPDLPPSQTPQTVPAAPAVEQRPIVALLLPLSGPSAAIGRALSDAATLALFDIGDDNFVLVPRDTGGTPEGATAAAREAIETGARLIVGPLFAAEVPSVASVAGPAGINVISLSNDRAIAGPGIYVFGLSPQGQIERILSFARTRGLQRYAALLPSNAYGAAIEDATRRMAALMSARMSVVERYDPTAGDATPVVRRLAAYEARRAAVLMQRRELEGRDDEVSRIALQRLESADGAGDVGFDSVLMPDFGDRLLSIAPLLPYYDIDPARIRFLGTAFWEDARLTREPALIGAWFPAPPPEARAEFQRRYRQIYGVDPPRIATLAYDSVALAAVLARTEGGPDFSAAAIGNPNGFAGVDGIFRFRSDGTVERGLAVLEVRRDGFRTISPAPNDFRAVTR
jgi:ABC-type branched-subunit amino acid transport system substrate-binding protein